MLYAVCVFTRAMIPETANDLEKMSKNMAKKAKELMCETFIFKFPADEEVKDE